MTYNQKLYCTKTHSIFHLSSFIFHPSYPIFHSSSSIFHLPFLIFHLPSSTFHSSSSIFHSSSSIFHLPSLCQNPTSQPETKSLSTQATAVRNIDISTHRLCRKCRFCCCLLSFGNTTYFAKAPNSNRLALPFRPKP